MLLVFIVALASSLDSQNRALLSSTGMIPGRRCKKQAEKESGAKRQRLLINSSFFRVRIGLTAGRSGAGDWVGLRTDAKRNAAFPDIQGKAELTGMVPDLTLLR